MLVKLSQLKNFLARDRKKGKRIVFTNGCFDILHCGHVRLLNAAKFQGDILIVGLNSDKSVEGLKGKGRPVHTEKARAEILTSLRAVDYVVIFNESTPLRLIKSIKPDVLVKGNDYKDKKVVGRDIVERAGGRVYLFPVVKNYSTTGIIEKIAM